jgi:hypothetical protein
MVQAPVFCLEALTPAEVDEFAFTYTRRPGNYFLTLSILNVQCN